MMRADWDSGTYRQVAARSDVVGAVGVLLEVRREESVREGGVDVDEELLEHGHDLGGGVVAQAAMAGGMAVAPIPVITAVVGDSVGKVEREQRQAEEEGHEMHCWGVGDGKAPFFYPVCDRESNTEAEETGK